MLDTLTTGVGKSCRFDSLHELCGKVTALQLEVWKAAFSLRHVRVVWVSPFATQMCSRKHPFGVTWDAVHSPWSGIQEGKGWEVCRGLKSTAERHQVVSST